MVIDVSHLPERLVLVPSHLQHRNLHPPDRPHELVYRPREGLRGGIGEGPGVIKKTYVHRRLC